MLDGKWEIAGMGSDIRHSSLLKAKRHCSNEGKCFGIMVHASFGDVYLMNFPIRLRQIGNIYYNYKHFHKKENVLGNIVYHEC